MLWEVEKLPQGHLSLCSEAAGHPKPGRHDEFNSPGPTGPLPCENGLDGGGVLGGEDEREMETEVRTGTVPPVFVSEGDGRSKGTQPPEPQVGGRTLRAGMLKCRERMKASRPSGSTAPHIQYPWHLPFLEPWALGPGGADTSRLAACRIIF